MADVRETAFKTSCNREKGKIESKIRLLFYRGKSVDLEAAKADKSLLGQNWQVNDNVDYTPTQDIRNKVKPLLKKQRVSCLGMSLLLILSPIT
jgi:hypothetical protein